MGKGLKSALKSQQSRLKLKEKERVAHKAQEQQAIRQKGGNLKGKAREKASATPLTKRPTIPFKATDRILLIGEGNFSFALALITSSTSTSTPESPSTSSTSTSSLIPPISPTNITATSYDSEQSCYSKYPESISTISLLRSSGVLVLFSIDATHLESYPPLVKKRDKEGGWTKIVWNFPHAGKGITDQDRNILSNQLLLLGFLRSASKFLAIGAIPQIPKRRQKAKGEDDDEEPEGRGEKNELDDATLASAFADQIDLPTLLSDQSQTRGTILITLRNVIPYTQWNLPKLAKNPPPPTTGSNGPSPHYALFRSFQFHRDVWKGYEHRMTKGERGAHGKGTTGEGGEDRTWEFYLRDSE